MTTEKKGYIFVHQDGDVIKVYGSQELKDTDFKARDFIITEKDRESKKDVLCKDRKSLEFQANEYAAKWANQLGVDWGNNK